MQVNKPSPQPLSSPLCVRPAALAREGLLETIQLPEDDTLI